MEHRSGDISHRAASVLVATLLGNGRAEQNLSKSLL